jgi:hypothetical protein
MFTIYRIKGLMVVAFTKNAPFGSPAQIAPADRSSPSTTGSAGTSASSSWMNLVERWFAELTRRKLRRSTHRSVTELEAGIRNWISEWNKDPGPFMDQDHRRDPRNPRRTLRTSY